MIYLTEKRLGEILKIIFPDKEFIHDKIVPESNSRRRPDYRCEELKLIIEFDGYNHYTCADKVLNEEDKTSMYESMGYKVVRIPYFIQLTTNTIKYLLGVDFQFEQEYEHGFIDKKCILPADFCELGIIKFEKDLERFSELKSHIADSLKNKIQEKGDIRRVIPKSLKYLVK